MSGLPTSSPADLCKTNNYFNMYIQYIVSMVLIIWVNMVVINSMAAQADRYYDLH